MKVKEQSPGVVNAEGENQTECDGGRNRPEVLGNATANLALTQLVVTSAANVKNDRAEVHDLKEEKHQPQREPIRTDGDRKIKDDAIHPATLQRSPA